MTTDSFKLVINCLTCCKNQPDHLVSQRPAYIYVFDRCFYPK